MGEVLDESIKKMNLKDQTISKISTIMNETLEMDIELAENITKRAFLLWEIREQKHFIDWKELSNIKLLAGLSKLMKILREQMHYVVNPYEKVDEVLDESFKILKQTLS